MAAPSNKERMEHIFAIFGYHMLGIWYEFKLLRSLLDFQISILKTAGFCNALNST